MGLKWIDVTDISINWLLMLQKKHIDEIPIFCDFKEALGIVLNAHPYILWYFSNLSPKNKIFFEKLVIENNSKKSAKEIRSAEIKVLESINDWLVYIYKPEIYENLSIGKWNDSELYAICDFTGKKVLDIGSGTGRLAFSAAKKARCVYAVEPVENLRRFLKNKACNMKLNEFYVIDGVLEEIPLEDDFTDVLLAGHVFGDCFEKEYNEMQRVTRKNGMMILFPGNNDINNPTHDFLIKKGFEWKRFEEPGDGKKRAYWKKNEKLGGQ